MLMPGHFTCRMTTHLCTSNSYTYYDASMCMASCFVLKATGSSEVLASVFQMLLVDIERLRKSRCHGVRIGTTPPFIVAHHVLADAQPSGQLRLGQPCLQASSSSTRSPWRDNSIWGFFTRANIVHLYYDFLTLTCPTCHVSICQWREVPPTLLNRPFSLEIRDQQEEYLLSVRRQLLQSTGTFFLTRSGLHRTHAAYRCSRRFGCRPSSIQVFWTQVYGRT